MELAVNMFTGGMVLDSHPLVQSSDTLSDALNATYITMNGNEVVLLNDMGNRRVDNAFLPAGYEPVGIKEHGGIIYIAAYNPITHRSQIGSFPSPERNMGTEYEDNGTEFNFSNFISENNILTVNGVKFLKDDILLFPLTKDTSLHAGDKFTVYSDYIWNYSHLITNFGTEDGNGIHKYDKTPFNSYFTLSLGVMNSLNEFSDITSTLERFDSSGNIIKDLKSNEDKFNTGYFIAPNNWELVNSELTGNNEALLENRGKIGANTYAYKLTGPLYLKAQLNHILTFSYTINMSKVMTALNQFTINLYITGTAVYNCPDSGETDESAYFDSFKLLRKEFDNPNGNYSILIPGNIILKESRVYDSITGLYTSSITKLFSLLGLSLENFNPNNYFLNYLIAVPIFHPLENNIIEVGLDEQIYLSNLSEAGSIDISKIGTNDCELGMWKYKNNISGGKIISTLLDYRFNCYTDLITSFRDLTITLYNQTTTLENIKLNDLVSIPNEISTGRLSILINWEDVKEESRINFLDLYLAEIKYTQHSESLGNVLELEIILYRFILGTDLFNDCYEESNVNDYVVDFGIFMGEIKEGYYQYEYNNSWKKITQVTTEGNNLRNKYLLVDLDTISNPVLTVRKHPTALSSQKGSPIIESTETVYNDLEKNYTQQVTINCASEWELKNKEKYPKNTFLLNLGITISLDDSDINKEFISEISCSEDLVLNIDTFKEDIVNISNITIQNNKCIFSLNLKDKIRTMFEELTRIIGKAYFNLDSNNSLYRPWIYNIMSRNLVYSNLRLLVNLNSHAGYFDYINSLNPYGPQSSLQLGSEFWGIDEYTGGSVWVSWFENGREDLYDTYNIQPGDEWNSWKEMFKKMKCPFTFGFTTNKTNFGFHNNYYTDDLYVLSYHRDSHFGAPVNNIIDTNYYSAVNYTRVWWADEDGNPCLLNNFNYNEADYEDELHYGHGKPGLFYTEGYELDDTTRVNEVYSGILKYLGNIKNNENTIYYLVVPIENIPYKAYYPISNSYIYFENPKVNLNVTVNYSLDTNTLSGILNNGCLFFNLPNSLSKSKELSTVININNDFSLSIIEMMLNSNLSSFSIDMEQKKVLSTEDPLKYLYVRKVLDNSQLKVVPINYPLQINEGVNNAFPIVCRKKYSSTQNKIGNRYLVVPWPGRWGDTNNWVDEGDIGFRTWGILDVHSQNIPVLFLEDLLNPIVNLFN